MINFHSRALIAMFLVLMLLSVAGCGTTATLFPNDLATISGEPTELAVQIPGGFARLYMHPRSITFISTSNERFSYRDVVDRAHLFAGMVEQELNPGRHEEVFAESTLKIVSIVPLIFIMHPQQVPLWNEKYPLPGVSVSNEAVPLLVDEILLTNKFSFSSSPSFSSDEVMIIADGTSMHVFELSNIGSVTPAVFQAGDWIVSINPAVNSPRRKVDVRRVSQGYAQNSFTHSNMPIIVLPTP